MRQIDFSDGYESAAAPDQGVITTGGFGSYSSDANFVTALNAAGGTLTEGHAYFNSLLDRIRFYSGAAWISCLAAVDNSLFGGVYVNDAAYIAAIALLGESLRAGSFYFNSTDKAMHHYDGAAWRIGVANDLQATLTNKDIDLGTASVSKRITISKATFAVLNALARKEGTIYYATDNQSFYFDNGSILVAGFSAPVSSVNGEVGAVILDTDDIAEGVTNIYFTYTRLKNLTNFKFSVRLASMVNVPLTGAVPLSMDGSTVAIGDRVLLAGNTDPIENGLYTYNDDTVNYTLTRATDADGANELVNGAHVYVSSGTAHGGFLFYITTLNPFTIGTNAIAWAKQGSNVVDDAIVNGVTTKAPSQNAVFDALALKEDAANKGIAGGYASLDGGGTVPLSQLPATVVGAVDYIGTWDAFNNSPDLPASTPAKGDYYVVNLAGTTSLGGITDWQVGDWAIFNGSVWQKVDNSELVTSVNGQNGTVVLDTDDVAEGGSNLYFTNGRAQTAVVDDAIVNGVTTKAPSQNAVFDALALKKNDFSVLPETEGGTNQSTYATGDTLYASGANTLAKRSIGTPGQALKSIGGVPTWELVHEPMNEIRLWEDWIGDGVGALRWLDADSGTGASATVTTLVSNNHPGILELATGTTNGGVGARTLIGAATGNLTTGFILGGGELTYEWMVRFPTLSNATDEFRLDFGLVASNVLTPDQVKFQYNRLTSGVNWLGITQAASVATTLDLGIVAAANTWYRLRAVVNAAASSIEFFVNGVSGGTITTNIPTAAIGPHCRIIKNSASAVSSLAYVDYFRLYQRFTTAR